MNYLIIGAGGTGGPLGAYLANTGKDVTFIWLLCEKEGFTSSVRQEICASFQSKQRVWKPFTMRRT